MCGSNVFHFSPVLTQCRHVTCSGTCTHATRSSMTFPCSRWTTSNPCTTRCKRWWRNNELCSKGHCTLRIKWKNSHFTKSITHVAQCGAAHVECMVHDSNVFGEKPTGVRNAIHCHCDACYLDVSVGYLRTKRGELCRVVYVHKVPTGDYLGH